MGRLELPAKELSIAETAAHCKPQQWPVFDGPLGTPTELPRTYRQCVAVFGDPGVVSADRRWKRKNIVRIRIPGVPNVFPVHRLAEPYIREGFRRGFVESPHEKINRVWGWVHRHQRHDPAAPLSKHAFGVAIDINSTLNKGIDFRKRSVQKPKTPHDPIWCRLWPDGLSAPFVSGLTSCLPRWGGDWDNDELASDHTFLDPMHFAALSPLKHRG